jgi:UDP-2,3-diacylglucosamine pyrophosphatase LpxH
MAKKRLFISDVHLGAGRYSDESKSSETHKYEWDWLSENETKNFESFIRFLRTVYSENIREIILLGDIFDNWVFPHDLVPPTMDESPTTPIGRGLMKTPRRGRCRRESP